VAVIASDYRERGNLTVLDAANNGEIASPAARNDQRGRRGALTKKGLKPLLPESLPDKGLPVRRSALTKKGLKLRIVQLFSSWFGFVRRSALTKKGLKRKGHTPIPEGLIRFEEVP